MIIRKGFVSNSSSSSFICDKCGTLEESEEYLSCENGHGFCNYCCDYKDMEKYSVNEDGEILPSACEVCNLTVISDDMLLKYLSKASIINIKDIKNEIRSKFKDLNELNLFLRNK